MSRSIASKIENKLILPILLFAFLAACGPSPQTGAQPAPGSPALKPVISSLTPAGTVEKTPFQVQPDGTSAISVTGQNFEAGTVVFANGQKLDSVFGNPTWVTATMPPQLFAKAGIVAIKVIASDGKESDPVNFEVSARR